MRQHLIATAAAAALLFGTTNLPVSRTLAATATTQPTAKAGPFEKVKSALEQLDLSTQQKEKIKGIIEVAHGKLEELRSQGTPDKTKAKEIVKTAVEQITGTLTTEQKTKFKELVKAEKA
jgi:Spy/CpxP family protein refolding chaperone